jgi:lipid II:glycine glycyltransferase (peptidoglycan interpeptide bridge formation enzyme)
MLRIKKSFGFLRHEVIWFATGTYSRQAFPANITYFRQHRIEMPSEYIVHNEPFCTLFLDLRNSEEHIWRGFTKTVRNEIGRAERERIQISGIEEASKAQPFLSRHKWFASRKHLGKPLAAGQLRAINNNWVLYTATLDNEWLADLLMLKDEARVRQWIAISNLDYRSRPLVGYASKSLVWRSIRDARSGGHEIYDFGGVVNDQNDPRYGITLYKQAFGGSPVKESNSLVVPNRALRHAYLTFLKVRQQNAKSTASSSA